MAVSAKQKVISLFGVTFQEVLITHTVEDKKAHTEKYRVERQIFLYLTMKLKADICSTIAAHGELS